MTPPSRRARVTKREASRVTTSFDAADIVAGLVLLVSIPVLILIVLAVAGKPVSGRPGISVTDRMRNDEAVKNRKPPPWRAEEITLRLHHVDRLWSENASTYLQRFRGADDPREKDRWYRRAHTVLSSCDRILASVETGLTTNAELNHSTSLQQIKERRQRIQQELHDLLKDKPFLDG